jgi:hypothetical protein
VDNRPANFNTFAEFYPFYLLEHRHPACRRLHFAGTLIVIAAIITAIVTRNAWWLAAAPLGGYGLAWTGHFFFEKNRPATFSNPGYSLLGDWAMFMDMLRGRLPF